MGSKKKAFVSLSATLRLQAVDHHTPNIQTPLCRRVRAEPSHPTFRICELRKLLTNIWFYIYLAGVVSQSFPTRPKVNSVFQPSVRQIQNTHSRGREDPLQLLNQFSTASHKLHTMSSMPAIKAPANSAHIFFPGRAPPTPLLLFPDPDPVELASVVAEGPEGPEGVEADEASVKDDVLAEGVGPLTVGVPAPGDAVMVIFLT